MKRRHSRAWAAGENRAVLVGNLCAHSRRCVRPTTCDGERVAYVASFSPIDTSSQTGKRREQETEWNLRAKSKP